MSGKRTKAFFTLFCLIATLTAPAMLGRAVNATTAPAIQASPDFILTISPASAQLKRGTGFFIDRTIQAVNGFNGTVTFQISGLPVGVHTDILDDGPVTGSGSSSIGIQSDKHNFQLGVTSTVTVTATSGNLVHTAQMSLTII
ncbi:MAG TPA: hypothetical protein VKZ53_23520 [Candidatus Angelobacter sp.]|nr:hypothetical protein [Candidatus Angelobacter sp.]